MSPANFRGSLMTSVFMVSYCRGLIWLKENYSSKNNKLVISMYFCENTLNLKDSENKTTSKYKHYTVVAE